VPGSRRRLRLRPLIEVTPNSALGASYRTDLGILCISLLCWVQITLSVRFHGRFDLRGVRSETKVGSRLAPAHIGLAQLLLQV